MKYNVSIDTIGNRGLGWGAQFASAPGRRTFAHCYIALMSALAGCDSGEEKGNGGLLFESETHFLTSCDSSCPGDLECLCGVCTLECEDAEACGILGGDAACLSGNDACRESSAGTCDVPCKGNADCSALGAANTCVAGLCRTATSKNPNDLAPSEDGGSSAAAQGETEGGVDGGGTSSNQSSGDAGRTDEEGEDAVNQPPSDETTDSNDAGLESTANGTTPTEAGATQSSGENEDNLDSGLAPGDEWVEGLTCSLGPSGQWLDVAERPGDENAQPLIELPAMTSAFHAGKIYVTAGDALWNYDLCSRTWTSTAIDWLSLPDIGSTITWDGDHFLGIEVRAPSNPPSEEYWLDPITALVEARPYVAIEAPPYPDWTDPESPGTGRYTAQGDTGRYSLMWGSYGFLANDVRTEAQNIKVYGNGKVYDRQTGIWTDVTMDGAPSPRFRVKIAPIGDSFFVWGGYDDEDWPYPAADSELRDGAIYDPTTNSWTPVSSAGAPEQTEITAMIAASDRGILMDARHIRGRIVVLGDDLTETRGGIYDVASDSWQRLNMPPRRIMTLGRLTSGGKLAYLAEAQAMVVLDVENNQWLTLADSTSPPIDLALGAETTRSWSIDLWTGSFLFKWGALDFTPYGCDGDICEGGGTTQTTRAGGVISLPSGL